jgi:glucose-1-phosphate thymidylyltransferase
MLKSNHKGIVLAGGSGTRLFPVTKVVSKQLLPIYNQPMIYYPVSTLINSGVKDIMIISTPLDQVLFQRLLGDGSQWGVNFEYEIQEKPEGIAQSLLIASPWLNGSPPVLILGDNLFFGPNIYSKVNNALISNNGATLFGYKVDDPERFGVVEFDNNNQAISIEEKPKLPKSNWAVTGLYIFNEKAVSYAKGLKKSDRGEYEITDINKLYLKEGELKVVLLDSGYSWLDTGTHDSLLKASNFVKDTELKSGIKVAELKKV